MPPGGTRRAVGGRPLAVVVTTVVAAVLLSPAVLAAPEDDLETAQARANQAAAELSAAEDELARTEDSVAEAEARVAEIEARVSAARDQVRQLAVLLYVGGASSLTRLLRMADANQVVRAQQYSHVVAGASADAVGSYRAEREDLSAELEALARRRELHASAIEDLEAREAAAQAELARLVRVVEEARAAREEQQRREQAAAAARAPAPPSRAAAPAASEPESSGEPADAPAVDTSAEWICPVQGPRAFSDDYGAPRGGGFRHQGNDILAPIGTPVVANVDGVVRHRSGRISGLAYYLDGDDGIEYFGAHLDSHGASGRVTAGTVIGTVGDTGDAAGGPPHLHFEMHPGGTGNINPYPTLVRYC